MGLPVDLPTIPTAAQLAQTNAALGTEELRPGYVLHRTTLAEHKRRVAKAGWYRGPWYHGRRSRLISLGIPLAELAAAAKELDRATT